jgi:hypothetical protein
MTDKPSKEQLEIYFRNSRKYFDSLAEHYKKTDPEYYNKVMKPVMYKNYFNQSSGGSKPGRPVMVFAIAVLLLIAGAAAAVFFAVSESGDINTVQESQSEKVEASKEKAKKDSVRANRQRSPLKKDSTGERRVKENKAERIR